MVQALLPDVTTWRTHLGDITKKQAGQLLVRIEQYLAQKLTEEDFPLHKDISLFNGKGGICLFYFYLYQLTQEEQYANKTIELLDDIIDVLEQKRHPYILSIGYSGIGWLLRHIANNSDLLDKEEVASFLAPIDRVIKKSYEMDMKAKYYDYLHGSLGATIYFLETTDSTIPIDEDILHHVVEALESYQDEQGAWRVYYVVNEETDRLEDLEEVCYNLGLSHGNPSIISILAMIAERGISYHKIKSLVDKNVAWLFSQARQNAKSVFTSQIIKGKPHGDTNLSWCYGDLSISASLLRIAQIFKDEDLKEKAIDLGRICAQKTKNAEHYEVVHFCHGTVGIAHIFNRLYQATKEDIFKEATQIWLDKTFTLVNKDENNIPFQNFITSYANGKDSPKVKRWYDDYSLIEGLAGVGLSLISLTSDVEPKWDRVFLLS